MLETTRNLTILVVDDEDDARFTIVATLERLGPGVRILEAGSGAEALETVAHESCDLMVLDLNMPRVDGYEVLEKLRRNDARPYLPILVISAFGHQDVLCDTMDAGADDFLPKPFSTAELLARVRSLLRAKGRCDVAVATAEAIG